MTFCIRSPGMIARLLSAVLLISAAPAAFALSNGCAAVNALSGSTSLSFSANRYPASDFLSGDALTLSFTDSGAASGGSPMNADSVSLAQYNLSNAQTYNAATNSTSSASHSVTITVPAGSLQTNGLAVRATTSHGQISDLVFNCTSASASSADATLASLTLSSGTLSPSFSASTSTYSASVSGSVSSVTVTPVVNESHATVTVNGSVVTSGAPSQSISLTAGSTTSVSVVVTAQDGSTGGYTLSISRAEVAPTASDSTASVAANSNNNAIPLALTGGNASAVTLVSSPAHGSVTISGTTASYTPAAGFSGTDSFIWRASNSGGSSADATVRLTVTPPALIFTPASGSLQPAITGSSWTQTLTATGGTSPYTWTSTSLPPGIALDAASGTLSGRPAAAGRYSFQVTTTDTYGATGNASYVLTVSDASPLARDSTATVAANSRDNPVPLNISGGTAISLTIISSPSHGSLVVTGTGASYTPSPGYAGNDSFTYTASNSSGTSAAARVTFTITPVLLTLSPPQSQLPGATAGNAWRQKLTVSGGTAPYTFSATALPPGLTLNTVSGELAGTPAATGDYAFQITATDSQGSMGTTSYTLSVKPAVADTLALGPAAGTLPQATAGKSYAQSFNVTGGTPPYRWQYDGKLPEGLIFAEGQLSGTAVQTGSSAFVIKVTDAAGLTQQASYTLAVAPAAPAAVDHSVSLAAGQSVTIDLTAGATGGPFTGAQLLDQPDSHLGSAKIVRSGENYQLQFTAAAQASGSAALRYVLNSPAGTTAAARILLSVTGRPDPSRNADVIGMVSAQFRAAQNFARAQLSNFSDRLEQLHAGNALPTDMRGIRFAMPSARPEHDADRNMWASAWQQQKAFQNERPESPALPSLPFSGNGEIQRLSYWTGGYVDFGGDRADGIRFSHTTVGITTGADYWFTPAFTAGMGIGFGRDVSDIGDSGTRANGRAFSTALYGSYHPGAYFVDGLLGHGLMDFDSRRAVSDTGAVARGSRSGRQVFTSLTTGYEFRSAEGLISPYGRLQYYRTWFDGFSETGAGVYNLAFAPQTVSQATSGAGLRAERMLPVRWGALRLQGRLEYAQRLTDTGKARMGYADTGNDTWQIALTEPSRQSVMLGTGIDFLLPYGITPGIAYQGTLGLDAQLTRDQMVMIRVNVGF